VYVATRPREMMRIIPGTNPIVARTEGRERMPSEMVSAIILYYP
jgi:hypothetical protein